MGFNSFDLMLPEPGLTGLWIGFSDLDFQVFLKQLDFGLFPQSSIENTNILNEAAPYTRALLLHFNTSDYTGTISIITIIPRRKYSY